MINKCNNLKKQKNCLKCKHFTWMGVCIGLCELEVNGYIYCKYEENNNEYKFKGSSIH